jgi:hypothetical protein
MLGAFPRPVKVAIASGLVTSKWSVICQKDARGLAKRACPLAHDRITAVRAGVRTILLGMSANWTP